MRPHAIRFRLGYLALALLLIAPQAVAMDAAALPAPTADAMAQAASPQAIAEYRRKLERISGSARARSTQEAGAYWGSIADKRRGRNAKRREHQPIALDDYVLTQPPVYTGPKRPVNPAPEPEPERPPREHKAIPVVADLLQAAAEQFQFTPQRPASELEFKRAYARVAAAAGLTREQAVRVYSFETGGTGNYDVQSGIEHGGTRAISTAIGYNQLLTTNSVELVAEQGHEFVRALTAKAAQLSGAPRQAMDHKIAVLKRMVALARSVPDDWSAHEKLARYAAGLGDACDGAGHRRRPAAADPQAADLGDLRARQGLYPPAHRRRTGDDEPDRRRHRARHGDDAAGDARAGPDLEFFPALAATSATRSRSATTRWRNCSRSPTARMDSNSNLPGARELAAAF